MRKTVFILLLGLVLSFSVSAADAAEIGTPIGKIYTTDILAYVDDAPIRAYALDGKTAIVVEDLTRYGFIVGYDDKSRTLYAFVKTNTYEHQPDTDITRGTVGQTAGEIYASDITTTINGVPVPCFTLNGVTAVAIEDIAADETQNQTSPTCMTYKWDAENRTITLRPIYDTTDKIASIFYAAGHTVFPINEIQENGVLTLRENSSVTYGGPKIIARLPEDAYAYPIRWQIEDGPVIGKAYAAGVTAPHQNTTSDYSLKTYKRYIVNWDIETLSECYAQLPPVQQPDLNTLIQSETLKMQQETGNAPQTYETDSYILLSGGSKLKSISKAAPYIVTDIGEYIAYDGYVNGIVTAPLDTADLAVQKVQVSQQAFEILCTYQAQTLLVRIDEYGNIQIMQLVPAQSDAGSVYTIGHQPRPVPIVPATVSVDGTVTEIQDAILDGMWMYLPLKDLAKAAKGDLTVQNDTIELTIDNQQHTYKVDMNLENYPSQSAMVYALSEEGYTPLVQDNKRLEFVTQVTTGHFENMSWTDITLPLLYTNGKIYAPIQAMSNFKQIEN